MESGISKLPIKVIAFVAKSCIDKNFNFQDPYKDIEENQKILSESTKWTGDEFSDYFDVEFMSKFLDENYSLLIKWIDEEVKFESIKGKLIIPKYKTYKVEYEVWGSATLTEKWSKSWDSYDEDYVPQSIKKQFNFGEFNYWDGDYINQDVDNFDADNFAINSVEEMKHKNNESLFKKLVIENTEGILDNLNKDDLLKLRNLINQKLSS